jgi:hypothetical protein
VCRNIQRYQLIRSATGKFFAFQKKRIKYMYPFLEVYCTDSQRPRGSDFEKSEDSVILGSNRPSLPDFTQGMVEKAVLKPRSSFRNVPVTIGSR